MDHLKRNQRLNPFALTLIFAFLLRMWDVNARSLWFDEAFEYWSAVIPHHLIPRTVLTSYQPPLYTIILHFWLQLGDSATWMRLLSVFLSLLCLTGAVALAWRAAGKRGALIAAILMAILPSEIRYAQEVGEYALMECCLAWSIYFLFRASQRPSYRYFAAWAVCSVLAIYSHYGAAVVIIPTTAALLVENALRRKWRSIARQMFVSLGALLFGIPLLVFFLPSQIAAQAQVKAAPFTGIFSEIARLANAARDTFMFPISGWPYSNLSQILVAIPIYVFLVISLLALLVKQRDSLVRVHVWFWVSFVFYFLLTRMGKYAYGHFGFRYMMVLVPLFIVTIASAPQWIADFLRDVHARVACTRAANYVTYGLVIAFICISIYALPNRTLSTATRGNTAWPETEDQSQVIQYWMENDGPDVATYIYYGAVPAFRYYLRTGGWDTNETLPATWYQDCWSGLPERYCQGEKIFYGQWLRAEPAEKKVESIWKSLGGRPPRFWIVFSHVYPQEDTQIVEALLSSYKIDRRYQASYAHVILFVKR